MNIFLNSVFIKEKTFDNGGSVLNVSINVKKFNEEITCHINEKGWLNFSIAQRKEEGKHGNTHYAKIFVKDEEDNKPSEPLNDDLPY